MAVENELFSSQWLAGAAIAATSVLTADWLPADTPPVRVALTVLGGPDGDVETQWSTDGSSLVAEPGSPQAPVITATIPWQDAAAVLGGQTDASVAYMQGRLKLAGDMAMALKILRWFSSPEFGLLRAELS